MRLSELAEGLDSVMEPAAASNAMNIEGLSADSRAIEPGYLFAALPGSHHDGRSFIGEALARGAVAVLAPPGTHLPDPHKSVALITDPNPRRQLALLAARFFGSQPATIAAVTGTSGKTSVADFARQIWQGLGIQAASLGTLGLQPPHAGAPRSLTTPDPVELHHCLAALVAEGMDHLVLEASSHGLDQYRLDGVKVTAAAFTNLSRDHLDYHGSEAAYFAAKRRLFTDLLRDDGIAVLNADDKLFDALADVVRGRKQKLLTYGRAGRDFRLLDQTHKPDGQSLDLEVLGRRYRVELPLIGAFQAENLLAALGLLVATGSDPEQVLNLVPRLQGVRGRLELVAHTPSGAAVYVDYAHKPDALETVLRELRLYTEGRLLVVFGCGGDRDRGKRPIMGEIAARLADRAIVSDDNPRSEEPAAIRREILAAAPEAENIGDREQAIATAVAALGPGDSLVIAGKGHEVGQTIGGKVLPFDDRDVARAAVAHLSERDS